MYWEQGFSNAPEIVRRCRDSWVQNNPDWEVVMHDATTIPTQFIPEIDPDVLSVLPVQMRSDLIRLKLLISNGGVWADATCLCVKPLDDWLPDAMSGGLFMFARPGPDREISNWFIAAEKNNYAINRLYERQCDFWSRYEFDHQSNAMISLRPILQRIINRSRLSPMLWFLPVFTRIIKIYPYFIFHYIFYYLILTDGDVRAIWRSGPRIQAKDSILLQRLGLETKITSEITQMIDSDSAPVYKLNHHVDCETIGNNSVLAYVLAKAVSKRNSRASDCADSLEQTDRIV